MTTALDIVLRLAVWLLLAPLLPGIINKVKAWVAGRRGPPVLQLYYDLAKLWQKGVVLSTTVSPGHIAGPAVAWVALVGAALLLPLGPGGAALSFRGDALLFVYLLAVARFCTASAALDTGSAFEGMGAAREVSYAVLAEAAVITALLTLGLQTGSVSLAQMLAPSAGAGAALLAAGLFTVLLAENCRVPFDDPNTHLELTMIHEVMVLDHSGPPLAAILHGASLKLLLFAVLLVEAVLPIGELSPLAAIGSLVGAVLLVAVVVGLVESLLARLAFRGVPLLLTTAFLLCLFALLAAWKGADAARVRRAAVSAAATSLKRKASTQISATAMRELLRLGQPRARASELQHIGLITMACACPRPVSWLACQERFDGVGFDVAYGPRFMSLVAHVGIPVVLGPEPALPLQQFVSLMGRELLPRLDNPAHRNRVHLEQDMDVVGHDDPGAQRVALTVKEAQRVFHGSGDRFLTQVAFSAALVEVGFKLKASLPVVLDFVKVLPFAVEFSGKTVAKPKCDELDESRFVTVRQITALVPAAETRFGLFAGDRPRRLTLTCDEVAQTGIVWRLLETPSAFAAHGAIEARDAPGSKLLETEWRAVVPAAESSAAQDPDRNRTRLSLATLLRLGQPRAEEEKGAGA